MPYQCAPVAKTGFDLTGPFFGTGSCRPAGTREPSPRAPHGVGSAGQPAGGPVWASWTQFPNRASSSQTCFGNWEMRTGRAPANPSPALPTAWGVLDSPRGGSLGQFGRVAKTGHALVDPIFATGRRGPVGHPCALSVCPSCQNGFRPHRPVFWNWVMQTGRHPRTLPPRSPRRGECWAARGGARLGQLDPVPKPGLVLADLFWELGDADR